MLFAGDADGNNIRVCGMFVAEPYNDGAMRLVRILVALEQRRLELDSSM